MLVESKQYSERKESRCKEDGLLWHMAGEYSLLCSCNHYNNGDLEESCVECPYYRWSNYNLEEKRVKYYSK